MYLWSVAILSSNHSLHPKEEFTVYSTGVQIVDAKLAHPKCNDFKAVKRTYEWYQTNKTIKLKTIKHSPTPAWTDKGKVIV